MRIWRARNHVPRIHGELWRNQAADRTRRSDRQNPEARELQTT